MLFAIDEHDARPIYLQLSHQVKDAVRRGELQPGDELPSVRHLAEDLRVNLHTVHRAYRLLREDGVIRLGLGRRARIAPQRSRAASREAALARLSGPLEELVREAFHLGLSNRELQGVVDEFVRRSAHSRRSL